MRMNILSLETDNIYLQKFVDGIVKDHQEVFNKPISDMKEEIEYHIRTIYNHEVIIDSLIHLFMMNGYNPLKKFSYNEVKLLILREILTNEKYLMKFLSRYIDIDNLTKRIDNDINIMIDYFRNTYVL